MRIDQIELVHVAMPLVRPFRTSFGVERERHCVLVAVRAEGLTGWGECPAGAWPGYSYETVGTAWEMLSSHFGPPIVGREIESIEAFRRRTARLRGHPMARSGLEMALWDLFGRANGESLQDMLGGSGDSVGVGVSLGIQDDDADLLETVAKFLGLGYPRVKLKIEPGRDFEPVRAVRQEFPDVMLQVDANAAYSLEQSDVFHELDELDLALIEQPLAEGDLLDHSRLQEQLATPLCLDESIRGTRDARQALEINACRVINIKQARVGGLTEAVEIHDLCVRKMVPVWCGGLLETGLGRAANLALASLPGFKLPGDISATDRYYERDIAAPRFELHEGRLKVPQGPGLGVEVDAAALDKFALRRTLIGEGN